MLAKYVSSNHINWDLLLPYVTFVYNSSCHDTVGYSSFLLSFDRELTLPLDTVIPSAAVPTGEYAMDTITRVAHARKITRTGFLTSEEKQRRLYDQRHRDVHFSPHILVLLWSPTRQVGLSEKLLTRYTGLYRVLRAVTPLTYEISPVTPLPSCAPQVTDIVHVARMKPYHSPSDVDIQMRQDEASAAVHYAICMHIDILGGGTRVCRARKAKGCLRSVSGLLVTTLLLVRNISHPQPRRYGVSSLP